MKPAAVVYCVEHNVTRVIDNIRCSIILCSCVLLGKARVLLVWINITSAVLRLECSLDYVSGSVGHQHRSYRLLYHSQRFL